MVRKVFTWISVILMIIGSITWMLIGIFGFNLVNFITFGSEIAASVVYILVGVAAVWMIIYLATLPLVNDAANLSISGKNTGDRKESYGKYDGMQKSSRGKRESNRSKDGYDRYRNY